MRRRQHARRRIQRRRLYAHVDRLARCDQGRERAGHRAAHLQRARTRAVSPPLMVIPGRARRHGGIRRERLRAGDRGTPVAPRSGLNRFPRTMRRPIALAALSVLELSPPDMVSCAAETGYDGVGLRLIPATGEEVRHAIVGDTPLVRETARRLADAGMRVLDIEIFRLRPDTKVADYRPALETGARFGARHALVAGNDPDERRLIDRFGAFCDLADEF